MARKAAPKLIDIRCAKCGKYITSTLAGAKAKCKKCQKWTEAKDGGA